MDAAPTRMKNNNGTERIHLTITHESGNDADDNEPMLSGRTVAYQLMGQLARRTFDTLLPITSQSQLPSYRYSDLSEARPHSPHHRLSSLVASTGSPRSRL
jgi:hypothetical protein